MELRQLTYFLAAAQTQNFRKAAELCFVTQPALSRQIAALEKELDIPLFVREKQRVRLTPAGLALVEYAKQATDLLHQGEQELVRWKQGESGVIQIGCNPSLSATLLPPLLASFRQQYPSIQLVVNVHSSAEVIEQVEQGSVDLGFIYDPVIRSEVVVIKELFRQPLHLLVPVGHPLAQIDPAERTLTRIVQEPLILTGENMRLRQVIERLFLQRNIHVQPAVEIASVEGLKELVKQGVGVTFIPPALLHQAQHNGELALFSIADVTETFIFALVYRRIGPLNILARQFITTALEATSAIVRQWD